MKFVDANIFIERWINNLKAEDLINNLNSEEYCTSVLVLSEVYNKLTKKNVSHAFEYLREIMGAITVFDITQADLFKAISNTIPISINDKIHIAVMKRHDVSIIISYDKDFDKEKTLQRMEP